MWQLVGGGESGPRLLRFVRIYLRNYRYDDYERARPRSVEYSPPRGKRDRFRVSFYHGFHLVLCHLEV